MSKYELTALLRFVGGLEVDADDDDGDELQILHLKLHPEIQTKFDAFEVTRTRRWRTMILVK